jgi:hypothetical protein
MAAVTTYPQDAVFQTAALEVILELPLDIARQSRALDRQLGLECGIVS